MKMSDDILDKKIREKINAENSYISQNIDEVFDKAINKAKRKKKNKFRNVVGICASLLVIAMIFGSTITTYASKLPIIANILEIFKSNRYENYDKYSSDLNITKESNGIKTTINKVIYDGIELSIFYTIESETPMVNVPYFLEKEIKINGESTFFGQGSGGEFLDNNKVYAGVISYSVGIDSIVPKEEQAKNYYGGYIEIPDEFLLSIKFNKIGDIKENDVTSGEWDFDIPVSNEKLKDMVKEYDLNASLDGIYNGSVVNKLILTPINTTIQGYLGLSDMDLYFIVIDDKGRYIAEKNGSALGSINKENNYKMYFNTNFKQIFEDTKSLTFIPYERNYAKIPKEITSTDNNVIEDFNLSETLNLSGETKLKNKDGNDYSTITRIEISDGKTKLYFKSDYGLLAAPKEIVDKNTNEVISSVDTLNFIEVTTARYLNETGEVMVEFNGELTGESYEVKYYDISEKVTVYNDNAFTVNLNK
ncbi:DUF4179 domain-containing protein [Clostridium sp. MB05]|jgi:Domain of unknown function (DUF4179)/Family of unknown function (DUF5643)|uniref:DUF4179 domain-containing protein n=1 Tax=Clostridium sp. MB05 TaxID=3376682 RepID=UPI0039822B1B